MLGLEASDAHDAAAQAAARGYAVISVQARHSLSRWRRARKGGFPLVLFCQELLSLPRPVRLYLRTHLGEVARVLARDASLWPEVAQLRLSGLDWRDAGSAAKGVLELAAEVREEPLFARPLATIVAASVGNPQAEWTPESLLEIADQLTTEAPLAAVELVGVAGQRLHWREDATRRLRALRQHPSAAIRAAAYTLVTANE